MHTYILHTRPFRDTSLIVELFSKEHGRVSVVAKSARGMKSRFKGQLQLFTPMIAQWIGAHELKTLTAIELHGMPIQLNQKSLFCGFYLNELLVRLLHKEDPHADLFDCYDHALRQLEKNTAISPILRLFEKKLLESLGYGLPLSRNIEKNSYYEFVFSQGFLPCFDAVDTQRHFLGEHLQRIFAEDFQQEAVLLSAKRLMRTAISELLGAKPLNSRDLF